MYSCVYVLHCIETQCSSGGLVVLRPGTGSACTLPSVRGRHIVHATADAHTRATHHRPHQQLQLLWLCDYFSCSRFGLRLL
jgi:hypothetical protein